MPAGTGSRVTGTPVALLRRRSRSPIRGRTGHDGRLQIAFLKTASDAEWTAVGRRDALWFPGPHAVAYVDRYGAEQVATARLSGPTLIWEDGDVTYRLEGVPRDEAVRIAESLT